MSPKKKYNKFPQSCSGCDGVYGHWENFKRLSGGCMKSFGNYYCTKGKRHFKLLKRDINNLRPDKCPIQTQFPIIVKDEDDI